VSKQETTEGPGGVGRFGGKLRKSISKRSVKLRRAQIVRDFNSLYFYTGEETWRSIQWRGVRIVKCPTDLMMYQEILHTTRPDIIVECGVRYGGTTLFLADMCTLLGHGEILGVDIDLSLVAAPVREHPRISLLDGSSTAPGIVRAVTERCAGRRTMVILDSDHSFGHVRDELEQYSPLVSPGCYLVVEDTLVAGHPVRPDWPDGGPHAAAQEFIRKNRDFEVDETATRLMLTFNPQGYLRRRV